LIPDIVHKKTTIPNARAERRGARHTVTIYHFPDVTLRAVREHRQAKELGQG
jgi:hypothetical protein